MKSASLARISLMSAASLALAACQAQDKGAAPAASESAASESAAAPDAKPGIAVSDAVLMLPVVAGRPGAAYFTVTNNAATPTTLAAVNIDGAAKTEMHETKGGKMEPVGEIPLAPGETVTFEQGGKHVMAFDLAEPVMSAKTVEMTIVFAGGDKLSVPAKVMKMGSEMHGMAH